MPETPKALIYRGDSLWHAKIEQPEAILAAEDGFPILHKPSITLVVAPTGVGKALAIDTPIPTPTGWTIMLALQIGDLVLGMDGKPYPVINITPIQFERKCYKVTFNDGTSIVADEDHLWLTETYCPENKKSIKTTKEIKKTLMRHTKQVPAWNHRIPLTAPLQLKTKTLPIDPYVLGLWLGDGTTGSGCLTCGNHDLKEIVEQVEKTGLKTRILKKSKENASTIRILEFSKLLKKTEVLGNKHIPWSYLRASKTQREALLQGLMDTDGTIGKNGRATFYSMLYRLANSVLELARSLGLRAKLGKKKAMLNGINYGTCYFVSFIPTEDVQVFRLERKLARVRINIKGGHKGRIIRNVEEIDSVPVKCIEVASPDHMYLAGDGMIPTHNSLMALGIALAVSTASKFLMWHAPKKRRTLYIDGEMCGFDNQDRLHQMAPTMGLGPSDLANIAFMSRDWQKDMYMPLIDSKPGSIMMGPFLQNDWTEQDTADEEEIIHMARNEGQPEYLRAFNPEVIIFDNRVTLFNSEAETDPVAWAPGRAFLIHLRNMGKTIILVHHAGKDSSKGARGSSILTDTIDTVVKLDFPDGYKKSEGCRFDLTWLKGRRLRGDAAVEFEAQFNDTQGWTYKLPEEDDNAPAPSTVYTQLTHLHDKILQYVKANPGSSKTRIAERITGNKARILDSVQELIDQRLLKYNKGWGLYIVN